MTPQPLKAILLMLTAMAVIPFIDVFAKYLGQQGVPVVQLVWARFFFGAVLTLPFALKDKGMQVFIPSHFFIQVVRAALLITGTAFFFWALAYLPIADTLAIYFIQPILVTALSPVILGEKVDARRWMMVLLGFIGVLIIIRPGFKELNLGVPLALAAGLCSACYLITTRKITGAVQPMISSFQTSLIGAVPLTLALPLVWTTVDAVQWAMMFGLGFCAILGHYLVARAYDHAEASMLSPISYTEMINAVICGYIFFNDFPDFWTFTGVGILMFCAFYISLKERRKTLVA